MGQRLCAGNHFAMFESAIVVSLLAADCDLTFDVDAEPAIESPLTLTFVEPLWAGVRPTRHPTGEQL